MWAILLMQILSGEVLYHNEIMPQKLPYESRECSVEKEAPQNFLRTDSPSIHGMPQSKLIPQWQFFSSDKWTPVQINFLNIKLFSDKTPVYGLNLGFVNSSECVCGLTFGIYNHLNANNGIIVGVINEYRDNNGIALACLANIESNGMGSLALLNIDNAHIFQVGIVNCPMLLDPGNGTKYQVGVINFTKKGILQVAIVNYSEQGSLLQLGCFNATDKNASLQIGCFNGTGKNNGVQIGCFNVAESRQIEMLKEQEKSKGWQLGIFNISENYGVQIGLINYNKNSLIPWLPLLNFSFPPSSDKTEGEKE